MARKGWAPPRKRPKRIAKKLERNRRRCWGWRENVIRLDPAASAEFLRQLKNPPPLSPAIAAAIRTARGDWLKRQMAALTPEERAEVEAGIQADVEAMRGEWE